MYGGSIFESFPRVRGKVPEGRMGAAPVSTIYLRTALAKSKYVHVCPSWRSSLTCRSKL